MKATLYIKNTFKTQDNKKIKKIITKKTEKLLNILLKSKGEI